MNNRLIQILRELSELKDPVTSQFLAAQFQVSSKTIQNDIKELNELLEEADARIDSLRGVGYKLIINDKDRFNDFFQKHLIKLNRQIPTEPEERIKYVMERLLLTSDYVKLEELAEELFISRSTLQGVIKDVREILKEYDLNLDQKPNYGVKVIGDEMKIRFCISEYVLNQNPQIMDESVELLSFGSKQEIETIRDCILSKLRKYQIVISDVNLHNLITHIAIACRRIREKNTVEMVTDQLISVTKEKEYKVAEEIVGDIEKKLNITFPKSEIAYISIHLQGTKLVNPKINKEELRQVIPEDVLNVAQSMIEAIDAQFYFNLKQDADLLSALCLHLKPAINRIKYNMNLRNPLLEEIKAKYPLSFEAALTGVEKIKEKYGIEFDENEIGYIALHIEVALERQKELNKKAHKCLIVCASGLGTSQLLSYKLKNRFGDRLQISGTSEYYNLKNQPLNEIDLIISTIPIKEKLPVPVIQISTILGDSDVKQIERVMVNIDSIIDKYLRREFTFLQRDFESPEEVIYFLGDRLMEAGKVGENYVASVLERESFSPTAFGNLVAIPHPIDPETDETFWSIVTLKKPILWFNKPVQFVCLLNINKNGDLEVKPMYEILVQMLDNAKLVNELIKCKSFDELRNIMLSY